MFQARQGDIFFKTVKSTPKNLKKHLLHNLNSRILNTGDLNPCILNRSLAFLS